MISKETKETGWKILKGFLIFLAVCFGATFINQTQEGASLGGAFIVAILLLLIVWAYPSEEVKGIKARIMDYKKCIGRWGRTALIILLYAFSIPSMAKNAKAENAPVPDIGIINHTKEDGGVYLGTGYDFEVKVKVSNSKNVKINDRTIEPNNEEYIFTGSMATGSTTQNIKIYASNDYKNATKDIVVRRDLTEQEKAEVKAKAEKAKAEQEALAAKQKQEAELAAKKAAQETAQREKTKANLQAKYERIAKNGYLYEIEGTLFDLGFIQTDSGYERASDGSNQIATYYEKTEQGFTITVMLQYAYASGRHYYRVTVE